MPDSLLLAPSISLAFGALLTLIVGKSTPGRERLIAPVTVAAAMALIIAVALFASPTNGVLPPGDENPVATFQADALSILVTIVVMGIALAAALDGLRRVTDPGATAARLMALAGLAAFFFSSSPREAAAALLIAALGETASARLGDNALKNDGPQNAVIAAAILFLAASAVGVATSLGLGLTVLCVLLLTFQYPFTYLAGSMSEGRGIPIGLAGTAAAGAYLTLRWVVPSETLWSAVAVALAGALTTVAAGALALRTQTVRQSINYLVAGQIGLFMLALGSGQSALVPVGILQLVVTLPLLASLAMLADVIAARSGSADRGGWVGIAAAMPITSGLFAVVGGVLTLMPMINGAFVAEWRLLSLTFQEGRWVFAGLALVGTGLNATAVASIVLPLFVGEPRHTAKESALPLSPALCAAVFGALLGASSWTGYDPVSRAAIAAVGIARARPVGADLFAGGNVWSVVALLALVTVLAIGLASAVADVWRMRRSAYPISKAMVVSTVRGDSGQLVLATDEISLRTESAPFDFAVAPRPLLVAVWRRIRGLAWLFATAFGLLEGRYYIAAILVFGLWIAITFLG